jgi:hypothetical protein
MNQMKTSWNHPEKKRALIWFLVGCFMILLFGSLDFSTPELKTKPDYLIGFAVFTSFWGYRAFFHSDDWFRTREVKYANWRSKHPRLEVAIGILILLVYLAWRFYSDFYFLRH